MPSLRNLGLFLGIAAVPVISLSRTAAANPWTAPVSLPKAALMVLIVASPVFGLALLLSAVWSHHRTVLVSVVGWFALFFVNIGGLRGKFEAAGLKTQWYWLIVVVAVAALAAWIGIRFDPAARYLATLVPTLVALQAILLIGDLTRLNEPTPRIPTSSEALVGDPPSIWLIVLDAHASPKALRVSHDVDLDESISRLERAGYRVWDDARSNYSHTLASLPSILSGEVWGPRFAEGALPTLLAGLRGDTSLIASIQQAGATIRMIPANWSRSSCGATVDVCFGKPIYNEHWFFLLRSTPLPDLFPGVFADPRPTRGLRSLDAIAQLPEADRHFTFVHSLASHPPTVMNKDCRPVAVRDGRLRHQLPCMHDVLWKALSTIDLTTEVVIIAADHGYSIGNALAPAEEWEDEVARDRLSSFVAISTPDECENGIPDELSTAQILPMVLNCYGADLPVPGHRFMKVSAQRLGGIQVTELSWDGWSTYNPRGPTADG